VCKSTIAMTDTFDIKTCNVVRKVDVGEALEVIARESKEDAEVEIKRLQFRAVRDGKEGWITLKGNQGTVFVEPSKSHFTMDKNVVLRAAAAADSKVIRTLKKGEVFLTSEEPIEEQPAARMVVRARAVQDGMTGWVLWSGSSPPLRPWKPRYVCKSPVVLTLTASDSSESVRHAEVGEIFDAVEGPALDSASGRQRIRCALGGAVVGWATIRSADGELMLESK